MECESEARIKQSCCYPETESKPTGLPRALMMLNQHASISSTPLSLLSLGNDERKAIEAHKLRVEQWRSTAIEYARRNTYR